MSTDTNHPQPTDTAPLRNDPQPPRSIGDAVMRALRQPSFIVVVVVLLTAAIGLNTVVTSMQLHFKKESVPLVKPLGAIAERFGTWVQVSQDQPLDHETQDVLGTDEYIFRDYVDESVVGSTIIENFRGKTPDERRSMVAGIRAKNPTAVVSLSVTYYTGMVDTVAHVPDRCVTADGYEPKSYEQVMWPIGRDLPQKQKRNGEEIEVRYINFEDQTGTSKVTRSITYFFHTNGEFVSSPLGVRQKLADLWEKRGYYAKIETMTTLDNTKESSRVMTDFLTHALPEVFKCLPDWEQVNTQTQVAAK